jgi:diguanylate cyclase (GGDEF)-like protein/PAS domain S-box-containing protein
MTRAPGWVSQLTVNERHATREGGPAPGLAGLREVEDAAKLLAGRGVRLRTVRLYACWAVLLFVAFVLFPSVGAILYAPAIVSTFAAMVVGIVRNRPRRRLPWVLITAAYAAFAAGAMVTVADVGAFPSVADVIFLVGYVPLLLAGLFVLTRSGAAIIDRASAQDAVILTIGAGFLAWTFLIQPFLANPDLPVLNKVVSIAYPLTDVLVLALLARLGLSAARTRSGTLLIVAGVAMLTSDTLYGLARLNSGFTLGNPIEIGWMLFYLNGGLAVLHPSMTRLTEPQVLTRTQVSLRRGVLTVASLLAPTALLVQALRGPVHDGVVIAAVSAVLILLALARMSTVAASLRQTLARERELRQACEALLLCSDADEVTAVLQNAVGRLLADGTRHRVELRLGEPGPFPAPMELVPAAGDGFDLALRCPLGVGGSRIGDLLVGGDEASLVELQQSLPVLAGQAATMIDRIRLNREINRRDSENYFRTLVVNASEVIAIVGDDNRITYVSPAAGRVLGTADLIGHDVLEVIEPDARAGVRAALGAARAGQPAEPLGLWLVRRVDGALVQAEVTIGDMRAEEGVNGLVLTLRDVTERISLENELMDRAYLDPLTGLGNRLRFTDDAAEVAGGAAQHGRLGAVLVVNVDGFRAVNDTMGHEVGDGLLVALGRRLAERVGTRGRVSRLGADEFGVVVPDAGDLDAVDRLAELVMAAPGDGLPVGDSPVSTRLRLGVATTLDADSADQLVKQADVALDSARGGGEPRWRRYDAPLHAEVIDRMQLRTELSRALADDVFRLHYQPIVELGSGRTVGFEALLRWPHPARGMVSPVDFIPLAEESGLIVELGAWVLHTAVHEAASWARLNPGATPYVSVNVSVRQFHTPGFVARVHQELATSGLPPQRLTLEITESLLLGEQEQIEADIAQLRATGIKVSIDDFGTGYSSLSYLYRMPVDTLKLDKSFVDAIVTSRQQHDLVRGILQMAASLSLIVVAEGIETEQQHRLLAEAGCGYGQGFLFARPLTDTDARTRVQTESDH